MDDDLLQSMVQDLHDAIGFKALPENALQLTDLQKISGLGYDRARRSVQKLVEEGTWKKQRQGNRTFYWKVQEE